MNRMNKIIVFLTAALVSALLMRILVRNQEWAFSLWAAIFNLFIGVQLAWSALQRWRFVAPLRCAALVGLAAGVAGAGAFVLFGYLLANLLLATQVGVI